MSQLFIGACDGCARLGMVGFETEPNEAGDALCLECSGLCDCGCTELGGDAEEDDSHEGFMSEWDNGDRYDQYGRDN